jgi:hypothetical protein
MDLNYSAEELAFRDEVRAWLRANLPPELREKVERFAHLSKDDLLRWHRILAKKGWIADAIKRPGAFSAKAKKAGKSTSEYARAHAADSGRLGRQARLAITLSKMRRKG